MNQNTSVTKIGWNSLYWVLRYGVHKVFGSLPAVTLTFWPQNLISRSICIWVESLIGRHILVPTLVTLNGRWPSLWATSRNTAANYIKFAAIRPTLSATKICPRESSFWQCTLWTEKTHTKMFFDIQSTKPDWLW